jgi:glucose 1-dehydrogenase
MRALTVIPGTAKSMRVDDVDEPSADGADAADVVDVVVEGRLVGVCGTDRELRDGNYGWAPPGRERLVVGHESLGVVRHAPAGSSLHAGDLVAGIVRRPDPVPCTACAVGQFDFCRNGRYTEHGIKELDGFARERWSAPADAVVRLDPSLGDLGVLMEPTSIVAKAWDQTTKIRSRVRFPIRCALVTGAGPVGLLAAMLGVSRGVDVDVLDQVRDGPKPDLVRSLGATYHSSTDALRDDYDVVMECTGAGPLIFEVSRHTAAPGILCLLGVSAVGRSMTIDPGQANNRLVLENDVIFGSVNANAGHWAMAAEALGAADREWLSRLVSRRVPLSSFDDAFDHQSDDIKVVIDLTA